MNNNNQVVIERDMFCPYCESNSAVLISETVGRKSVKGCAPIGIKNGCLLYITGGCWAIVSGFPLFDTKEEIISHSIKITRDKIYPLLKEKLNCEGLTLAQNNELGQEIKHYHIHLIPRYPNDHAEFPYDQSILDEVENIFNKLKK